MKLKDLLLIILGITIIYLLLTLVINGPIIINFLKSPWEAFTAMATILLAFATFKSVSMARNDLNRRKELEEIQYWGGLGLRILDSGTINILNNSEYRTKLISCEQKIHYCEGVKWEFDELGNPKLDGTEYDRAEKKYMEFLADKNRQMGSSYMLLDNAFYLDPKEQVSLDDSLAYNLSDSDSDKNYFATFLLLRLKWQDEKIREKSYLFRYSAYKSPQGWVRVG